MFPLFLPFTSTSCLPFAHLLSRKKIVEIFHHRDEYFIRKFKPVELKYNAILQIFEII